MDLHTTLVVSKIKGYQRVLAERVKLNREILDNPYWFLSVEDDGKHRDFEPVGRSTEPTSEWCSRWLGLVKCPNFEGHKMYGEGKVVLKHKHVWCHRADCCVCFIRGWSVRGARNIVSRLDKAVERGVA